MKRVIIESPYAGDVEANTEYARRCMLDSLRRGEAPFASHLLYTQVLDDGTFEEREAGMEAALEWSEWADLTAVYIDRGISEGMKLGIEWAESEGREIEYRSIE